MPLEFPVQERQWPVCDIVGSISRYSKMRNPLQSKRLDDFKPTIFTRRALWHGPLHEASGDVLLRHILGWVVSHTCHEASATSRPRTSFLLSS